MNNSEPRMPVLPSIGEVLRRLPQWPPATVVALALNAGVANRLDSSALARLVHKVIRIRVSDAGIAVTLCYDGQRFVPRSVSEAADVTITASAWDYLLLAARREDPDTLFFARRMLMEGNTETGLMVKNMLDALDLEPILSRIDRPLRVLGRLRRLWTSGDRHFQEESRGPLR